MRIGFQLAALVVAACGAAAVAQAATPAGATPAATYIVTAADAPAAARAVARVGGRVLSTLPLIDGVGARLTAAQRDRLAAQDAVRVQVDRTVTTAGRRSTRTTTTTTSTSSGSTILSGATSYYSSTLSYTDGTSTATILPLYTPNYPALVGADTLHAAGITGAGITIAVLDSGLWQSPTDSWGTRVLAKADFVDAANGGSIVDDKFGHGTHISSIMASGGTNIAGQRFGVAPDANLVVARAFGADGSASYLDVIEGLNWIVANRKKYKIRVLNLSFGAPPQSYYWDDPLNRAVMAAWKAGIVVVASAGNSGPGAMTIGVPGNVPYVITAGALTDNYTPYDGTDDRLASFSSTGPTHEGFVKPEVVAPGGHIAATMPDDATLVARFGADMEPNQTLFTMSGTSQAAAVTTGVVALLLQSNPQLTPDDVKCKLMAAARPAVDSTTGKLAYSVFQQGSGLINAVAAVNSAATGCANVGIDVAADLAGTAHFGGPANRDEAGNYYVMDMWGGVWGQPVSGDGYTWSQGYVWSRGYTWSQGYVWSRGYTWSQGYVWSRTATWTQGYTWSQGYVWSRSLDYLTGAVAPASLSSAMCVNPWVAQE